MSTGILHFNDKTLKDINDWLSFFRKFYLSRTECTHNSGLFNDPWTRSSPAALTRRVVLQSNTKRLCSCYKSHLTPLHPFDYLSPWLFLRDIEGELRCRSTAHSNRRKSASRKVWSETPFTTLKGIGLTICRPSLDLNSLPRLAAAHMALLPLAHSLPL